MLTGRRAFAGETVSDTIAKILEREPDWSALPPATPVAIPAAAAPLPREGSEAAAARYRRRQDRDRRDRRGACPAPPGGAVPPPPRHDRRAGCRGSRCSCSRRRSAVWEVPPRPVPPANPFANARFSRLTDWQGTKAAPRFRRREIRRVHGGPARASSISGVSQVGTGPFLNLTRRPPVAERATFGADPAKPRVFRRRNGDLVQPRRRSLQGPKVLMPLTGGTRRPFLREKDAAPSWSPDGLRLAHFNNGNGDPLYLADRTGADPYRCRWLKTHGPGRCSGRKCTTTIRSGRPTRTTSGSTSRTARIRPTKWTLMRVRPSGGSPEPLTTPQASMNYLAPSMRARCSTSRGLEDRSGPWLWTLDVRARVTRRVVSGLERYTSVSASRDGRRVVVTSANPSASLWPVPISRSAGGGSRRCALSGARPSARSRRASAGRPCSILSANGTGDGLWRFQDGKTEEIWNGADAPLAEPAAVSPGGQPRRRGRQKCRRAAPEGPVRRRDQAYERLLRRSDVDRDRRLVARRPLDRGRRSATRKGPASS